jgi:hypothetical protein
MRAMPTAMLPVTTTYRPPFRPRGRQSVPVLEYDRQVWGGELSAADDADGSSPAGHSCDLGAGKPSTKLMTPVSLRWTAELQTRSRHLRLPA